MIYLIYLSIDYRSSSSSPALLVRGCARHAEHGGSITGNMRYHLYVCGSRRLPGSHPAQHGLLFVVDWTPSGDTSALTYLDNEMGVDHLSDRGVWRLLPDSPGRCHPARDFIHFCSEQYIVALCEYCTISMYLQTTMGNAGPAPRAEPRPYR